MSSPEDFIRMLIADDNVDFREGLIGLLASAPDLEVIGEADSGDQAIALAVISLGHRLHLRVIAEGVETEEQREFLAANECDEMQGYLFSPPVPADDISAMLQAQLQPAGPA